MTPTRQTGAADGLPPSGQPRVAIVATGGTIQNTEQGRVGVDVVLRGIEDNYRIDARSLAEIHVIDLLREAAEDFTPHHWAQIAHAVREAADDRTIDGIVVTHGTFTVEETSYFLHLTVGTPKPIVVTCSQRAHRALGNDGDHNLIDAIRVSADPESQTRGVVVVAGEEVHSAREITKTSQRPAGFTSRRHGILGTVDSDGVTWYRHPTRRHTFASEFSSLDLNTVLPRVDIVSAYPGADGAAVGAFVAAGAAGIVVEGFSFTGAPHVAQEPDLFSAIETGVAVVLTSRGRDGRVPSDAQVDGRYVTGDDLTTQKARVLLITALAMGVGREQLPRVFDQY